ncbi:alpha/beta hydrolase [Actinomyces polynesiensis]|uniref:alpha/beta hydrolase n=1 Tax=Actinomyces polynesiensis TaxID=1325934 RepID=UPI0009394FD0|nr:alpha/beta hydrolase [Actinomyces polynesiensis]
MGRVPPGPLPSPRAACRAACGAGRSGWGSTPSCGCSPLAGGGNGGALLWIHGGGLVVGAAVQDDARCIAVAEALDIVVASVDYRLDPQDPYPAAIDDCHTAWGWLVHRAAQRGIDTARLAIGGQSAGGGLSAALVQRVHDEGGPQPTAQWLFCPMLDDRTAADHGHDAVHHFVWTNDSNRVGWSSYLGQQPGAATTPPYAVPARRTDLSGLPDAWIGTGDIELFRDEDRACAEALTRAGVDCTLDEVVGAPHAFETYAPRAPVTRGYMHCATEWLRARVG